MFIEWFIHAYYLGLCLIKNNMIYRFYNFELAWLANWEWFILSLIWLVIHFSILKCILVQTMFILNANEPTFNVVWVVFTFTLFNLLQSNKWICAKIKQSFLDKILFMSTTKDMESSTFFFLWGADKPIYLSMHYHIWLEFTIHISHRSSSQPYNKTPVHKTAHKF